MFPYGLSNQKSDLRRGQESFPIEEYLFLFRRMQMIDQKADKIDISSIGRGFVPKGERVSFYSHLFGMLLSVAGTAVLLSMTMQGSHDRIVVLVYGLSVSWLFSASAIYHAQKRSENSVNIWRKFDHFAIFFMIAGTYTPLCYYTLTGPMRTGIIAAQWTLVVLGVFFKLFFMKAPRWLYTAIYIAMGWMAIIPIRDLFNQMNAQAFQYLILGGIVYTIGAVIYARKRPNPIPGLFGFHEIFHILIVAAAVFHFAAIYICVANGLI